MTSVMTLGGLCDVSVPPAMEDSAPLPRLVVAEVDSAMADQKRSSASNDRPLRDALPLERGPAPESETDRRITWPPARIRVGAGIGLIALLALLFTSSAMAGYVQVGKWGSKGSGPGQFQTPYGIAVDGSGYVYVTDSSRVEKFTAGGKFVSQWHIDGPSAYGVGAIAASLAGNIYVANPGRNRVERYTANGTFLGQWGSQGKGNGQFSDPAGIATDSAGNVYVVDSRFGCRIEKFSATGAFLAKWGKCGAGDGQFNAPTGIATDSAGNVYVVDSGNYRVQQFSSDGRFLGKWGSAGGGKGQFSYPTNVATAASTVFVVDSSASTVQAFTLDGKFASLFGGGPDLFSPTGIATDKSGNVYLVDGGHNRVVKFVRLNPPDTRITAAKISSKRHRATFSFEATGQSRGFQCSLDKPGKKGSFKSCDSPKTYKHLDSGSYRFRVRAVGPGGKDPSPASKRFRIG